MTQPNQQGQRPNPRSAADAELQHMFRNYRGNAPNEPWPVSNNVRDARDIADAEIALNVAVHGVNVAEQLAEMVREQAAHEALVSGPARREAEHASRLLKARGGTLEPVREKLRMARKPRMRTVEQYLCDHCDTVITKPTEGYIVHGNIYVAEPSCRGGLVGNNFPEVEPGESITPDSVKQTVFCKACFLKALGLELPKFSKEWDASSAIGRDSMRRNPYNGGSRA